MAMEGTQYGFSVSIKGRWRPVGPTGGEAYRYDTAEEAKRFASMCYGAELVSSNRIWRVDAYGPVEPEPFTEELEEGTPFFALKSVEDPRTAEVEAFLTALFQGPEGLTWTNPAKLMTYVREHPAEDVLLPPWVSWENADRLRYLGCGVEIYRGKKAHVPPEPPEVF